MVDGTALDFFLLMIEACNTLADLSKALSTLRHLYSIDHAVFHVVKTAVEPNDHPLILTTYPQEWVDTYTSKGYFSIDPVVAAGRGGFLPFDWSSLDWSSRRSADFLREADCFGVGRHGVTVTVRGPFFEKSLFTITSTSDHATWMKIRHRAIQDFQVIGHHLHQQVMQLSGLRKNGLVMRLTPREKQCLELLARGRLPKQIANDLDISERTVRLYLTSCRSKLGTRTTGETIAKGIVYELVRA